MIVAMVVFVIFGLMAAAGFIDVNDLNRRATEEDKEYDSNYCAMGRVWEYDDMHERIMQDIRDNG